MNKNIPLSWHRSKAVVVVVSGMAQGESRGNTKQNMKGYLVWLQHLNIRNRFTFSQGAKKDKALPACCHYWESEVKRASS